MITDKILMANHNNHKNWRFPEMTKKIAISDSLSPIKKLLSYEGYDVINIENEGELSGVGMEDYDAIVVSGIDENLMGMQQISGRALIVDAAGKSPEEILDEIHFRLGSRLD